MFNRIENIFNKIEDIFNRIEKRIENTKLKNTILDQFIVISYDVKAKVLSLVNWCFNREILTKSYLCTSLKAGFF